MTSIGYGASWREQDPTQAMSSVLRAREMRIRLAREDPDAFIEHVLRHEQTGQFIRQEEHHLGIQAAITQHHRTVVWSFIEGGKTAQVTIGRVLWEIGRNPDIRVAIGSSTLDSAKKFSNLLRELIEHSDPLHEVFPELQPGPLWGVTAFTVKRHSHAKDPTVQLCAPDTSKIQGARLDLVVLDDILSIDNTLTAMQRDHVDAWFNNTIAGRLTAKARVIILGNAFHPDDLMHRLAKRPAWKALRISVEKLDGTPRWPAVWSRERIDAFVADHGPIAAGRLLFMKARTDADSRFKLDWIKIGLALGDGKKPAVALQRIPPGCRVYTGVDIGVKKTKRAAKTVFATVLVHPSEVRELIAVESGKWSGSEITDRAVSVARRFGSILVVESNAAQAFLSEFIGKADTPVIPFDTGKNKLHPDFGIESLAVEMAQGRWVIPNDGGRLHPTIADTVQAMLDYDPATHTGDELMALWFAREAARLHWKRPKVESGYLNTVSR